MPDPATVRLVFAGTPDFAVPSLQALLDAGYRPRLVLTQPDRPAGRGQKLQPPPVKTLALENGLPVAQPERLVEVRDVLEELRPDVMVIVAYAHKIPSWLLALPSFGCLNVHASLLPKYRGASPIAASLLNGDRETGVSVMLLEEGWDTGPVFRQRAVPILPEDNAGTLSDKLARTGAALLVEVLPQRLEGKLDAVPQDERLASYAPRLEKDDGRMDWNKPAERLAREVRAYTPWPGAFTFWEGKRLKVLSAHAVPGAAEPGEVRPGPAVGTGEGLLALHRVQLEGRKPLTGDELVRGHPRIIGARLGEELR